ncbi:DUF1642 domain-containing protein [Enterococcus faecium]|uniref:DUF1642 domain-containing protein n=1 Tax=Enterococcus faecium TaxID=1352 RepID=UPI0021E6DF30|nr:DUF1642 domain-containing protein [Enterococcus faecium]MCV3117387.1 DUF1642 domain-containing protein [Enterococcus faecium]MDT2271355.1 DUF1642 domain-containing protein [Enterococcus faecium]
MNKQEQKNKLWALKWIDKEIEENEHHARQKTGTEANTSYWKGYVASCKNIRYIVKELDEHPKHVMPKFFDDWANRVIAKHDEFYAISLVARAGWGYGVDFELSENGSSSENKELLYWIVDKCNDNYPNKKKAIEALLYGYEVEKVLKYIVKIGKLYLKEPLGDTSNSTILTTWDKKHAYPFSSFHTADKHADKFEGAVVEVAEG